MILIRFLLFAVLFYLLYRVIKIFWGATKQVKDKRRPTGVIDEMVQDPFCKTYIPRREAIRKNIGGKEYFFCSQECADKFQSENEAENTTQ
ncbi:MAG: YHS domain-containing protein [Deltaproteobacteria bacterium]|nr:YHS domain-containing protein [Deltaproteobacteria bacterium]